jgi:hypothetical protein
MCDSITCIHTDQRTGSSLTATAGTALATIVVAGLAVATFRIMAYVWPLYLTAWCIGVAWVWAPRPTRAVLRALRRAIAWAWRRWVRKPAPAAWTVTAALPGPDGAVQAITRTVPAAALTGRTADAVAAEVRTCLVAEYGQPAAALTCRVEATR